MKYLYIIYYTGYILYILKYAILWDLTLNYHYLLNFLIFSFILLDFNFSIFDILYLINNQIIIIDPDEVVDQRKF